VPAPYTNSLNECLKTCDDTPGCIDVSWVIGTPGPCYMKGTIGDIRVNSNIYGGRQLSGCKSSSMLKLHRKRVVHETRVVQETRLKGPLKKRGLPLGPDSIYLPQTSTVVSTSTTTATVATSYVPFQIEPSLSYSNYPVAPLLQGQRLPRPRSLRLRHPPLS
jgi:hypothetical protein